MEPDRDKSKPKLSIRGSEDPERSFISSFLYWLNYQWKQIMLWLAPVEGEHWMMASLKYLGKLIALIIAILLSPVLLFILITLVFLALQLAMQSSNSDKWKVIKSPWFYSAVILFIIHQILQWGLLIHIPFADNYLDPFLFLPIVLGAYLQERRLILKNVNYKLNNFRLIGLSILLCVLVEFVFPYINPGYTLDLYDFVAYGAGAFYFNYTINRLD